MNRELVEGDLVYTADCITIRILGFSEILTEPDYNVIPGNGQIVEVGEDYLWKVSSAAPCAARTRTQHHGWPAAGTRRRRDRHRRTYRRHCPDRPFPRPVALSDGPADHRAGDHQEPAVKEEVQAVRHEPGRMAGQSKNSAGGVITFAGKTLTIDEAGQLGLAGQWFTLREMTDAVLGRPYTRREREAAKLILRRLKPASREGYTTFATSVHPVDEVLIILATSLEYEAVRSDSGTKAPDLEAVVSTREMAKMVICETPSRTTLNYAVRATAPIDGPDVELLVDPYLMGAWLGDGNSRTAEISSGWVLSCTDDAGVTDQQHMMAQLRSHYPDTHNIPSSDYVLAVTGLKQGLRIAGVLTNKHIPAIYLRAPYAQRVALLQGLTDADGTANVNGSSEIDLCHKPLADCLLGTYPVPGHHRRAAPPPGGHHRSGPGGPGKRRQRVTGTRYRMKFTTGLPIFRLPRKLERIPTDLRATQQWNYIKSITVSDPGSMRYLKVEHPEHLYLTRGFIPTHPSVL